MAAEDVVAAEGAIVKKVDSEEETVVEEISEIMIEAEVEEVTEALPKETLLVAPVKEGLREKVTPIS